MSVGLNRETGKILTGIDHIAQSIEVILTTSVGSRVMREWFGVPPNAILGENMVQTIILRWWHVVSAALLIFEPRFVPRRLLVIRVERSGTLEMNILGDFKPYAHLGFEQAALYVAVNDSGVVVRRAT